MTFNQQRLPQLPRLPSCPLSAEVPDVRSCKLLIFFQLCNYFCRQKTFFEHIHKLFLKQTTKPLNHSTTRTPLSNHTPHTVSPTTRLLSENSTKSLSIQQDSVSNAAAGQLDKQSSRRYKKATRTSWTRRTTRTHARHQQLALATDQRARRCQRDELSHQQE